MKQLETKNQKLIRSCISFYNEIGIKLFVNENTINNKKVQLKENIITNKKKFINLEVNSAKNINELEYLFEHYDGCSLKKTATKFVKFSGNFNAKLLFIDGTPDIEEDRVGESFVSDKGVLFTKMLNAIELNKDDTFIVKSIPWRPPGNRFPTYEELKICRPFIFNLIRLLRPKIIVCFGEVPTNQVLDLNNSIIKTRGKWHLLKSKDIGISDNINYEYHILPTLSVSHLLKRPDLKKYAWYDLKLLRDKIKEIL